MTIRSTTESLLIKIEAHKTPIVHVAMYRFGVGRDKLYQRSNNLGGASHIENILHLSGPTKSKSEYPHFIGPINPTFIWMADPHNAYFMRELNRIAFELLLEKK